MIIYEYLLKAAQDDARRASERDRLVREARRARRARRQRPVPAAPARRRTGTGKIVVSENVTLDGVIQDPAGDEGFRARGRVGPIGNSPQLAKLALDEGVGLQIVATRLDHDRHLSDSHKGPLSWPRLSKLLAARLPRWPRQR